MSFDPVSLFGGGEVGVIYDVQDVVSMFQDSAGTTPAAVDSPVGRINDKSGGARHAIQATSTKRPILRNEAGRGYYLESDGTDDFLEAAFAGTLLPFTRVSLIEQRTWTSVEMIFNAPNSRGRLLQIEGSIGDSKLAINDGSANVAHTGRLMVRALGLVTEIHNGASSSLRINQDTPSTGNPGSNAPDGIRIFANSDGTLVSDCRLYGVVMINRVLTETEIEDVQYWLTQRFMRVVVVDGDSNTWTGGLTDGYADQFVPNASPEVFLQNIAVPGTGFDTGVGGDLVYRAAEIDRRLPVNKRGRQYVYFPWWSNNALADQPDDIAAFLQARKAAGWDKVGIGTWVERTDGGHNNTSYRLERNAIIRAPGWIESKGIDFLVDFASEPTMGAVGASTNTTYFDPDLVHILQAGHTLLEPIFRAAINAISLGIGQSRGKLVIT